jgi:hypothetical protein
MECNPHRDCAEAAMRWTRRCSAAPPLSAPVARLSSIAEDGGQLAPLAVAVLLDCHRIAPLEAPSSTCRGQPSPGAGWPLARHAGQGMIAELVGCAGRALDGARAVGLRDHDDRTRRIPPDGVQHLASTVANHDERGVPTCGAEYEPGRIAQLDDPFMRFPGSQDTIHQRVAARERGPAGLGDQEAMRMGAVDDRGREIEPVRQDSGDRDDLRRELIVVDRAHHASPHRAGTAVRRRVAGQPGALVGRVVFAARHLKGSIRLSCLGR